MVLKNMRWRMQKIRLSTGARVLAGAFLATALVQTAANGQFQTISEGKQHTSVRLVADVASVQPGRNFVVGVVMKMDKGWHTYWKNSGEAGLPTTIDWKLPEGLAAEDIRWPLPDKHIEEGDILTYGYSDETMLLVPIRVSRNLPTVSSVTLSATVNWLECERICVPGKSTVELEIPISTVSPHAANPALFARYLQQVPGPLSASSGIRVNSLLKDQSVEIHLLREGERNLIVTGANAPDFFPEPIDSVAFGRTSVEAKDGGALLKLPLMASERVTGPAILRGVVVYCFKGGARQAVEIQLPVTAEFCAGLRPVGGAGKSGSILDQSFVNAQTGSSPSLILYLLFALIGGLLLNIMPCVLPVIALKVFGLVKMAGDQPAKIRRLGWMFSLGILVSFLALALLVIILQTAGQQVGWGFQFQEPLFVIAMAAVVFAFGLSLFGVFEIQLPSAAVTGVSAAVTRQSGSGKGYATSFSEGIFATILATPCTAPFLGAALGFAFAQPWWVVLLIFTTVALGMALPYLLLTAEPAWVKYLPKPGEWMVTAKQFMGFFMMATLIWLLYILGKQLGMEGVIWTSAFLLTVGVACWLVGRFATLVASRKKFVIAWTVAVLFVAGGYWIFLESILDVRNVIAGTVAPLSGSNTTEGIAWKAFTLADLENELRGEKTVFVDFTAEWCLTCKVNEKSVLADRAVIDKFKALNVVSIRADWTNRNPDITRLLQKFGRSGVPLYVIFPPARRNAPIVLPEVITAGIVLEALDKASGGPSS
jgi:thiol:disulfide interchange protein/DsbC/DsbD-like thiol-disulfide interchange protein